MQEIHEPIDFQRLKPMIIELDFREINKTVKNRQRNLETLACKSIGETVGVHQRAADSLQRL